VGEYITGFSERKQLLAFSAFRLLFEKCSKIISLERRIDEFFCFE